ncbi:hypothetical protein OJAV_G00179090 [Oryzias javanicus]|uniref:Ig-like domain-containing protein n=1 Tax=Oryzias javanicus TaxID=123683 RepID=A0A3S2NVF7_ORYJA|nr:hypothetical protein OJAV_G00179090 [Oryzias javanicus]
MSLNFFVFFLTCLVVGTNGQKNCPKSFPSAQEKSSFLSVCAGENITLECSYDHNLVEILWYKQSLGQKPKIMSIFYGYTSQWKFFEEFENDPRFKLDTENKNHHLKIFNLQFSDSATYHCIISDSYSVTFSQSFIVNVKDSSLYLKTSVDQSSSENIHAGDSVTLNCTVHTGSCDGEHRVYWFKDSEDSHPGLIYTHGGRNDQCERNNKTQTHSCVYELDMKNLNKSHSGIYYCAVVSCGHILFGNGTKLDLTDSTVLLNSVILSTLVGLLTIMSVLVVYLLFILWKINKNNNCISTEQRSPAAPSRGTEAENKDAETLHYAAINVKRSNRSRRQKNDLNTVCVYSSVTPQN